MDFDTALAEAGELGLWQWAVSFQKGKVEKENSFLKKAPKQQDPSHHPGVVAARAGGSPSGNVERPICICWLCPKTQVNLQIC